MRTVEECREAGTTRRAAAVQKAFPDTLMLSPPAEKAAARQDEAGMAQVAALRLAKAQPVKPDCMF
jgi:hypothetical protein